MTCWRGRWRDAAAFAALVATAGGAQGASGDYAADAAAPPPASQPAGAAGAKPTPEAPILKPEDELILEARTDKWILTDAFPGYATARGDYVPLGELSKLLDLAITVDGDVGRAEGWFLDPDRTLRLDLGAGFVETSAGRKPLRPEEAVALNGDIYVRADVLGQWLPLEVDIVLAKQQLELKLKETFPFEAKIQRAETRTGLGFRKAAKLSYPRLDDPYELLTAPAFDVNVRGLTGLRTDSSVQYDLRSSGDFAFMSTDLFLGGDNRNRLSSARLTMRRRDPDGEMLGPLGLTLIEFGDTSTVTLPIGMRSSTGRGIILGNAPLDRESVFDRIDLRGELPLGYEVELYRNDLLIGSVDRPVDGRYEFLQVPLEFGMNVLRLVFYGPRGERREEVRRINAGEGRLGTGEFQFSVGAVQQDRFLIPIAPREESPVRDEGGPIRAGATAEFGLTPTVTLVGSAGSFVAEGQRTQQGLFGVRTGLAGAAIQADAAFQGKGRWALQLGLGGRLLGTSYILQHADFSGDFVDEVRGGGASGLRRITQLRLDRGIDLGDLVIATNIAAERTERRDGQSDLSGSLRASTNLFQWLVSNSLNYRNGGGQSSLDGALEANGRIRGWSIRTGFGYDVRPAMALRDFNLTVDRTFWGDMALRAGVTQQLSRGKALRTAFSLSKRLGFMDVAADAQYDTSTKGLQVGARFSFSIGRPGGRWGFSPPGLARGGSLLAMAFQDADGDGRFGTGDKLLEGVKFRGVGADASTDASGRALLTSLGDGRPVQVTFLPESLSDPYLMPMKDGLEVVPRPGRTQLALFPVATVSEVEGRAYFEKNGVSRAVANVELELLDPDGKVVETTKTEYDGFFLFEKVRPGRYRVRVNPEQAEKLKLALAQDVVVQARSDGGLVEGLDVRIVSSPPASLAASPSAN